MKRLSIIALLSLAATSALAQSGPAFRVAESGRSYGSLQQAVDAIGSGQGTIIIAPGIYQECAIQAAGSIAYKAAVPGQTVFDRQVCENKAAMVFRGQSASVDGIVFQNMHSSDQNGSGLRLELGDLVVTRSIFRDSEQGILTSNEAPLTLSVDQSTFSGLGLCANDCAHSIYAGHIARLTVTNCRFERGTGGHYVKFRGKRAMIRNNAFDDSRGTATNYLIDLPNGATGDITDNIFVQGPNKENGSALITVAPEGKSQTSAGLSISDNDAKIAPGARDTVFVANWSGEQVNLGANRLGSGLKPYENR
jgi:hypothetical protein